MMAVRRLHQTRHDPEVAAQGPAPRCTCRTCLAVPGLKAPGRVSGGAQDVSNPTMAGPRASRTGCGRAARAATGAHRRFRYG